jgi:hypothetical protein
MIDLFKGWKKRPYLREAYDAALESAKRNAPEHSEAGSLHTGEREKS